MEQALLEIIDKDVEDVDLDLLGQHTKPVDVSQANTIAWERVEHLHIIGKQSWETTGPAPRGIHISQDGTWVLLSCLETEELEEILLADWKRLTLLEMYESGIKQLDVSAMRNLRILRCRQYGVYGKPGRIKGIENCCNITGISLVGFAPESTWDVSGLTKLEYLLVTPFFSPEKAEHLLTGFENLPELSVLVLDSCWDRQILDVSGLVALKALFVMNAPKLSQIQGLDNLINLEQLCLDGTGLKTLPEGIRGLRQLKYLSLERLSLDTLPDWLPELGLEFHREPAKTGVLLKGTTVKDVDMSIFDQPQEMILKWFEERKQGNEVPLNEIKVVFLGDGEVGKSHTIARLLNNGGEPGKAFTGSSTPGIAIEDKTYDIDGQKVQVHFWDFGGQDILYSMHRMFLTRRTLYVILVDARNESKGNQAKGWLDTVKSFAEDAPVMLVVNKTDQNPAASIDEETLKNKFPNLKKVIYMSALTATPEVFNAVFTDSMVELIRQSGVLNIKWPKKWIQVKDALQTMKEPYIFNDAYEKLCHDRDVDDEQINLLDWFNDLGVSFCQFREFKLRDYVILRPDWMTNAIYTILFNKRKQVDNGMISLEEIAQLLNPTSENKGKVRRVKEDTTYNWTETSYILDVVRKFSLSYSVNKDTEFFPMLCTENAKPLAQDYADAGDTLEFRMKFAYLPSNVLHRLMVERWPELDTDNIWLTGARFVQQNTGLSAVVRIDGNVLQIYVRGENDLHTPNTYLSVIEGSVDRIRQDLKLPKPTNFLVYKLDGKKVEFGYERILKMHARGKEMEYSHELDQDIPIRDILNQFAPAESTEQEQLLADLVKACGQLQEEKLYWDAKENARTTSIRNALTNMGYIPRDQTLGGISGGETEEGERDLEIRKYKDVPWTICEALRVNSGSKTDWNFHLKKLLDNYNPNGRRFLILLTYVDDKGDKFDQIWESFKTHIQGHSEGGFAYKLDSFKHYQTEPWTGNHYIQTARSEYVKGNYTPTVYHIFVRMGR